mmetsp:Transcript_7478/g.17022  ORF Transcript_7478/g.17022 Transcript_7478/m.17022 type:complete len:126 (-) Transcript_7478:174-551(-)
MEDPVLLTSSHSSWCPSKCRLEPCELCFHSATNLKSGRTLERYELDAGKERQLSEVAALESEGLSPCYDANAGRCRNTLRIKLFVKMKFIPLDGSCASAYTNIVIPLVKVLYECVIRLGHWRGTA